MRSPINLPTDVMLRNSEHRFKRHLSIFLFNSCHRYLTSTCVAFCTYLLTWVLKNTSYNLLNWQVQSPQIFSDLARLWRDTYSHTDTSHMSDRATPSNRVPTLYEEINSLTFPDHARNFSPTKLTCNSYFSLHFSRLLLPYTDSLCYHYHILNRWEWKCTEAWRK